MARTILLLLPLLISFPSHKYFLSFIISFIHYQISPDFLPSSFNIFQLKLICNFCIYLFIYFISFRYLFICLSSSLADWCGGEKKRLHYVRGPVKPCKLDISDVSLQLNSYSTKHGQEKYTREGRIKCSATRYA